MKARGAIALSLLAAASPARAEFPVAADLGLRIGYALPFGRIGATQDNPGSPHVSDITSGEVPIGLDLGVRLYQRISGGLFLSLGPAFIKSCDNGAGCTGLEFRVGVQGVVHLLPRRRVDPWLGVGIGYERLQFSTTKTQQLPDGIPAGPSYEDTFSVDGFEVHFQLGCDYRISPHFGIGPFVSFSVGEYRHDTTLPSEQAQPIDEPLAHEWLLLGARLLWTS